MFDWSNGGGKVIVKLPFSIYFGATAFLAAFVAFFLFIIYRNFLKKPVETEEDDEAANYVGTQTNQNDNTAESDTTNDGRGSIVATGLNTGTNGSMDAKSRATSLVNKSSWSENGDVIVQVME
jgi:hypothetical protein